MAFHLEKTKKMGSKKKSLSVSDLEKLSSRARKTGNKKMIRRVNLAKSLAKLGAS